MRIIFKKFRTRMIVGCILAVIALLAVSVVVFINQPSFGRTPRGERLERVMKSPNYRNGGYDTHYAEIGNRFPNIDLAILENGQYNEDWRYIHTMPEQLPAEIHELDAAKVLPVHNSKFSLSRHAWDEPVHRIEQAATKDSSLHVIHGIIGSPIIY